MLQLRLLPAVVSFEESFFKMFNLILLALRGVPFDGGGPDEVVFNENCLLIDGIRQRSLII